MVPSKNDFLNEYRRLMIENVKLTYPTLKYDEVAYLVDSIIAKKYKNDKIQILNNYKNREVDTDVEQIMEFIKNNKPILIENGCLFRRHEKGFTLFYRLIDEFVESRKKLKKKMFQYDKGTDEFNKYNLMQLLAKRDANAMYGYLGSDASSAYNLYVAVGITATGRALIMHAISFFEQFFTNNIKFQSIDEVLLFIDRVCKEEYHSGGWLDKDISLEDCWYKLMVTCDERWVMGNFEKYGEYVWNILASKSQDNLNRIYYKNNFFEFINNSKMKDKLYDILNALGDSPFMDPNKAPENIVPLLDEFTDIVKDWCYMRYILVDKFTRISTMKRDISLITDTDSTIISTNEWYLFMASKVLENRTVPLQEKIKCVHHEVEEDDFDLLTGTSHKVKKDHPEYVGENEFRISIINILAYVISKILRTHFDLVAENYHTKTDLKMCLINMKNEFLFKRVLLSNGKKNYATIQELQEGNLIPKDEQLTITGLPIKKTTLKKSTQKALQGILRDKILLPEKVSQMDVIKALAQVEQKIRHSLETGQKEFYKPVAIKSIHGYDDPMRIQGIKASIAFNELRAEGKEAIDLDIRNSLDLVKVKIDKTNILPLKESNPELYTKLVNFFNNNPEFKGEITTIAIPQDEETPKWILDFIDYNTIINDNLKVFPLEAIGITKFDNERVNYTNILSF